MASPSQSDGLPTGQMRPASTWGQFNQMTYLVQSLLNRVETATLVKVVSCTNSGGLSPVGCVDVVPLVQQVDGAGVAIPNVTAFNLPYLRIQGGANAVIIDPEPGDIGIAVFASRDISKAKATKAESPPGSWRTHSLSDGMYVGGVLNGSPTQYVQFNSSGIKIHSPTAVKLDAPSVQVTAQTVSINASTSVTVTTPTMTVNGNLAVSGSGAFGSDVVAQGVSVHNHVHMVNTTHTPTDPPT